MRYWTSGEVPTSGDYIYVERLCDQARWSKFQDGARGKILALHGPRQSGKTSLLNRLAERASKSWTIVCVNVDAVYQSDPSQYPTEIAILDELLSMIAEGA